MQGAPGTNRPLALLRLVIISFLIACLAALPDVAEVKNWDMPPALHTMTYLPHACLGYLEVFFHEMGHTVAFFFFGQPAVPFFNFNDGGGLTTPVMDRSIILQLAVYAGLAYGAYLLYDAAEYFLLGAGLAVTLVLTCFALGSHHYLLVTSFMGHGGSTLVGCYCLYRALLGRGEEMRGVVERYTQMSFGIFVPMHNMVLSWSLMTSDIARDVYNQGIGGHIANDYAVIAGKLGTSLQHVAAFGMAYTVLCIAGAVALAVMAPPPAEPAGGAGMRMKMKDI